ncbi:hypothetical protein [Bradyrhizobium lablabi]|uniref:hypothetical protein n=1 Tax=Bradyrhizobium lablabi TaxID=722472 RepID=UPI001BA8A1E5|nr:hypothetical protein [Bradyrhizobium lablabi]MBR0693634.1 hypothetical protein [Bradyrhizobium lablabi]
MKVYVLVIDHKHGTEVSAFASRAAADQEVQRYCDEQWPLEFPDVDRPDDAELIAEYWHLMTERGEEWHLIEECEVVGNVSIPPIFIPENSHRVKPGYYTRPDVVRLLRLHRNNSDAILFIADMLE